MNTLTAVIAALVAVIFGLGATIHREKGKRSRAEERADALSKNAENAQATARVLHEIANETDDKLKAAQAELEEKEAAVEEAEEELQEIVGDTEKIAGAWNKTFKRGG